MTTAMNVTLLPQSNQLRAMHTVIRDRDASPRGFAFFSRRIIRGTLETGVGLLPFEERAVTTPVGQTYRGLRVAGPRCGVSVVRAGESRDAELREHGDLCDRFCGTVAKKAL